MKLIEKHKQITNTTKKTGETICEQFFVFYIL